MASTLSSLTTRVRALLVDSGADLWTDAAITESIRLAVGEYNLAAQVNNPAAVPVTLNGLDGAAATTLPEVHDTLIVWGASAYAAQGRVVDRAELHDDGAESKLLKAWGDARLREFKVMLGSLFPGYLVVLAGSGEGGGGEDPAKLAAEIALMGAQASQATSTAAHIDGQESREAAAAAKRLTDEAAEAARLADLRSATNSPWGSWVDDITSDYPDGYENT